MEQSRVFSQSGENASHSVSASCSVSMWATANQKFMIYVGQLWDQRREASKNIPGPPAAKV